MPIDTRFLTSKAGDFARRAGRAGLQFANTNQVPSPPRNITSPRAGEDRNPGHPGFLATGTHTGNLCAATAGVIELQGAWIRAGRVRGMQSHLEWFPGRRINTGGFLPLRMQDLDARLPGARPSRNRSSGRSRPVPVKGAWKRTAGSQTGYRNPIRENAPKGREP